jgi:hypothetical protein
MATKCCDAIQSTREVIKRDREQRRNNVQNRFAILSAFQAADPRQLARDRQAIARRHVPSVPARFLRRAVAPKVTAVAVSVLYGRERGRAGAPPSVGMGIGGSQKGALRPRFLGAVLFPTQCHCWRERRRGGRHRHLLARRPALRLDSEVTAGAFLPRRPSAKPNPSDNGSIVLIGNSGMRPPRVPNDSWYPIESAPLDEDVVVEVTDGRGAPYPLRWPCRKTAAGWINSAKGTPLAVTPVRWRPYYPPPVRPQ